jgi:hypothetical protein
MGLTVCCPSCWTWSELKRSTTCKRCGTPLILPDGRRVDEPLPPPLWTGAAQQQAAVAGWPAPPSVSPGIPGFTSALMPTFALPAPSGVDWTGVARWITVGYGALAAAGLVLFGLVVRHLSVTVLDPNTGRVVHESLDIGAPIVIAAALVAVLFALFAWLTQFTVFRVVMLFVVGAGALGAISRVSTATTPVLFASLGSLVLDAGFCFVLVMSILARPRD